MRTTAHSKFFSIIVLLSVLLIANLPSVRSPTPHKAAPAPIAFTLYGAAVNGLGWGFNSSAISNPGPPITVSPGAAVTLTLISADPLIPHQFCIDYESFPDYQCNTAAENSTESKIFGPSGTTYTFTATMIPGNYTYFCTIHTIAMRGQFRVVPPDFSISAQPNALSITQGAASSSIVTLASFSGFSGTVALSTSSDPVGLFSQLNETSVTLSPGQTRTLTLDVSTPTNVLPGNYTVSVIGTNASLIHTETVQVQVLKPDFIVSSSENSVTLSSGESSNDKIDLSSQSGFSGVVDLSTISSVASLSSTLSPSRVALDTASSASSILTVRTTGATPSGQYQLVVNATSGVLAHSLIITIVITVAPPSQSSSQSSPPVNGAPISVLEIAVTIALVTLFFAGYVLLHARKRPG